MKPLRDSDPTMGLEGARRFLDELQLDERGFLRVSTLLKRLAGIHLPLSPKNLSLVAARLSARMRDRGVMGYEEYVDLVAGGAADLRAEFVQALTTNTTHFFREAPHFAALRTVLAELTAAKSNSGAYEWRLWCAATSTGQEPYSIAMTLAECIPDLARWGVRFLASDIDLAALGAASKGLYSAAEMKDVPPHLRQRFFAPFVAPRGERLFRVKDELRELITFAPLNLVAWPYPFQHRFDIVFCRNVLIYFDRETAAKVVQNLVGALSVGGCLFLGHSESGVARPPGVEPIATAVWRKVREK